MVVKFTNNAIGTLASAISNVETSITVSGDEGNRFPSLSGGDYFYATLVDEDGNREIVKVTARVGNTMTVERAQQGTSARAFDAGSKLSHRLTAADLNDIVTGIEALKDDLSNLTADAAGALATGGTSTAYTLTTNQAFSSLTNGISVTARIHATNGAEPTLAVDGLAAKSILGPDENDIPVGALIENGVYTFVYNSTLDGWLVHNRFGDTLTSGDNPNLVDIEALGNGPGAIVKKGDQDWTIDDLTTSIIFVKDTGNTNVALSTGVLGELQVDFACTITGVTLLADKTGGAVVDIWKDTYTNYPPTVADSICGSSKPTISNSNKYNDTSLSGWTKTIAAGDILRFNLDSVSSISRLTIKLRVKRYA